MLAPLQRQLGVTRAEVAFYPSLFALALVLVGLFGGPLLHRTPHRTTFALALAGLGLGGLLLAAPARPVTLLGAALLGLGGALMVQVIPAALSLHHGAAAPAALGEANAVSSLVSVLAPTAVALALAAFGDWRVGYLVPVPVAALLVVAASRWPRERIPLGGNGSQGPSAQPPRPAPGLEPGPLPGRWADVLLAVSVEFCLVFWAADALRTWHGASPAGAAASSAAFLLGMAVIRAGASRLVAGRHPATVALAGCAVALIGFATFWAAPTIAFAVAGLFVTGAGLGSIYPTAIARLVAAWPHAPDRAAAFGALASGTAIGVAPLVLARLSEAVDLRTAYLIVPVLLVVLAAHAAVVRAQASPAPGSTPR